MKRFCVLAVLVGLTMVARAEGPDWPQWRGPSFTGVSPAVGLPDTLDKEKNLRWSTPLPGRSDATPVVVGDRVFVSSSDKAKGGVVALCLDGATGKVLWQQPLTAEKSNNGRNNFATPSPAADARRVVFLCGSGDVAAFDHDGKKLWARNIQKEYGRFTNMWVYSSSPLLLGDRVYIQVLQAKSECYLLCLNAADGKEIFKQVRATGASEESADAYTTPIPCKVGEKTQLLLIDGDRLTAHDAETGAEVWRFGGYNPERIGNWRVIPSPVAGEDVILFSPARGRALQAVRMGGQGDISESHKAWQAKGLGSDSPSPTYADGSFYLLDSQSKSLVCFEAASGKQRWSGKVGTSTFSASPTVADGKVYCMNEAGEVFVLSAREFKILSKTALGGGSQPKSTIAVAGKNIFVRTADTLYCFGEK